MAIKYWYLFIYVFNAVQAGILRLHGDSPSEYGEPHLDLTSLPQGAALSFHLSFIAPDRLFRLIQQLSGTEPDCTLSD